MRDMTNPPKPVEAKAVDAVPARKKPGRPKTRTAEELRTYQREYKRKWRANNGGKA